MHGSALRAGSPPFSPPRRASIRGWSFPVIDRLVRDQLAELAARPVKVELIVVRACSTLDHGLGTIGSRHHPFGIDNALDALACKKIPWLFRAWVSSGRASGFGLRRYPPVDLEQ